MLYTGSLRLFVRVVSSFGEKIVRPLKRKNKNSPKIVWNSSFKIKAKNITGKLNLIFIYKALPPLPQTPASNGNLMVSPPRIRSSVHLGKITLSIKTSDFRNMRHIEQWVDLDNPYSKGAKVRIGLDFLWKKNKTIKIWPSH